MALAVGGALGPSFHDRTMSRRRTGKTASTEATHRAATGKPASPTAAAASPKLVAKEVGAKEHGAKDAAAKELGAKEPVAKAPGAKGPVAKGPVAKEQAAKEVRRRRRGTADFEERIGYRFKDVALLEQALTHISALTGARNRAGSYQRLEFLGDHVLGLVVSDMLFRAFAKADEGEMSRRLADLVRKEACADVAREIDLGQAIRLGASEANAGGRGRIAILADVCEALIGAVFIDGGYPAASALIERLWSERMRTPARPLRDSKTVLQEWAQARGLPTPAYREVERKGPDHDPEFRVTVELPHLTPAEGLGRSKRAAEQAAAAAMLTHAGVKADRLDG
jgi:ribonuclease-3